MRGARCSLRRQQQGGIKNTLRIPHLSEVNSSLHNWPVEKQEKLDCQSNTGQEIKQTKKDWNDSSEHCLGRWKGSNNRTQRQTGNYFLSRERSKRNAAALRKQSQTNTVFSNEKLTQLPTASTRAHAQSVENLLCYLWHPHVHSRIERESLQGITEEMNRMLQFRIQMPKIGLPSNQEINECEENVTSRFLTLKNMSLVWYHTCNISKEAGLYSHRFSGLMFVTWSYEELVESKISIQGKEW